MDKNIHARDAQLRAISIYARRPDQAQVMHCGIAEIRNGLTCTYEQDGHRVTIDMPTAIGGDNQGPSQAISAGQRSADAWRSESR